MNLKFEFTQKLLKKKSGIALMFAIFSIALIMFMVMELSYQSSVEYSVNAQGIARLKAYYAAKSGVELSLLRIKIYNQVISQFGDKIPPSQLPIVEKIWNFPFAWPPPVSAEVTRVNKENIEDSVKEAMMDASYVTTISDEGSKIDINDLASPSKYLRETTKQQLLNLFENKKLSDENWAREYQNTRFDELVNNIADWVDLDKEGQNSGDESSPYADILKGTSNITLPPNRAFRTVDELRMVAGMKDAFFDLIKDQITVYGMKAINPNSASPDIIRSLDTSITEDIVQQVVKRRSDPNEGGPFTSAEDFWDFLASRGARISEETQKTVPISFDAVNNFRIVSTGSSGKSQRQITAIVYDLGSAAQRVADKVNKEKVEQAGSASSADAATGGDNTPKKGTENSKAKKEPLPKGPPRVVYWIED